MAHGLYNRSEAEKCTLGSYNEYSLYDISSIRIIKTIVIDSEVEIAQWQNTITKSTKYQLL